MSAIRLVLGAKVTPPVLKVVCRDVANWAIAKTRNDPGLQQSPVVGSSGRLQAAAGKCVLCEIAQLDRRACDRFHSLRRGSPRAMIDELSLFVQPRLCGHRVSKAVGALSRVSVPSWMCMYEAANWQPAERGLRT